MNANVNKSRERFTASFGFLVRLIQDLLYVCAYELGTVLCNCTFAVARWNDYVNKLSGISQEEAHEVYLDFAVCFHLLYWMFCYDDPVEEVANEFRRSLQNLVEHTVPVAYAVCHGQMNLRGNVVSGADDVDNLTKEDYEELMKWLRINQKTFSIDLDSIDVSGST